MIDLYILMFLGSGAICFITYYFRLRRRMTHDLEADKPISYFTRRRVEKFIAIIMAAVGTTFLISLSLVLAIKSRGTSIYYTPREMITLFLFGTSWSLVAFGQGLYIGGVLIEQYSMHKLRENPEYARLKVATNLIHGKLSHLFICSGGMAVLFTIAVFELFNPSGFLDSLSYFLYIFCGIVFGFTYYIAQIKNFTWRTQLPFFFLIFLLHFLIIIFKGYILNLPFNIFFLFFSGTASFSLIVHLIKKEFF